MSVLLIGFEGSAGSAAIDRLLAQGDQVQVLEPDPVAARTWRDLGAFVAAGQATDADLVERAAYETRTVALFDRNRPEVAGAVLVGAQMAGTGRMILVTDDPDGEAARAVSSSAISHVIVTLPKKSRWGKGEIDPERLAEVIDAADDLAGEPRLAIDLATNEGWEALGLDC